MKTFILILLLGAALHGQNSFNSCIDRVKSGKISFSEFQTIFEAKKTAIPELIKAINDTTTELNFLINPINSNILSLYTKRGIVFLYLIELIMKRDSLLGHEPNDNYSIFQNLDNYLYMNGIVYNEKEESLASDEDLVVIKKLYETWWEHAKVFPLEEIRKDYNAKGAPLFNTNYHWR